MITEAQVTRGITKTEGEMGEKDLEAQEKEIQVRSN
jgi:hypothetical protein